ncbi:MAG: endospore germination permease [Niameybacter sp.]
MNRVYTHNANVSVRQIKILFILQMFNMSMLILPRIAGKMAGHDGYLLPILAFAFGAVYVWSIVSLLERFPGEGLDTIAPKVVTKVLGMILIGVYIIKIIIGAGLEVRMFAEMVSQVLLPKTPLPVIILILLFAVHYLIKSGLEASGRMAEIVAYFVFVPFAFVLAMVAVKTDYKQLMPFGTANPEGVIRGAYFVSMTFMPLEFMLIIGNLVSKPYKLKSVGLYAIGVISILEVILIGFTFTGVGMVTATKQIWPVLTLMQSIQLPGSFVENQEIFMMAWWILSVYMYISGAMYVASLTMSRLAHFNRQNVTVMPLIPIVFFISMIPGSLSESYSYLVNFNSKWGLSFLLIIPLVLLLIAKVSGKGGEKNG